MNEPTWKQIKLSLEQPYKDDSGDPIPVLLDILPDGQRVYEPCVCRRTTFSHLIRLVANRTRQRP